MQSQFRFLIQLLCFLFVLTSVSPSVVAQEQLDIASGDVQLTLASFGVGRLAREGDWAGIQVQMLDTGTSGRDVVLRVSVRDEDGDQAQYDRIVTANPGVLQSFWIYCKIPYRGVNVDYEIRAFEAIDTGNDDVGQFGFRVGRMLGQLPIYNPQIHEATIGLGGVIGNSKLSLDKYGMTVGGRKAMLFGHELFRIDSGLELDNLPDRWQGYKALDALFWSGAGRAATSPGRLSPEKARAIRTWVSRGGHLVIVMESSGDPWFLANHPLRSILPDIQTPLRQEGVDLEKYRSLITESATIPLPKNGVVYSFESADSETLDSAYPVLNGPDGECIAIRRFVGSGMVTVIGLPLTHGGMKRVGLPDPQSFWHRILGMRGEIRGGEQLSDELKNEISTRTLLHFDEGISGAIAKTGRAVQGILFGVIVFVLYWLIAGPVGYGILKSKGKKQHAWMFFVATTGVFTGFAWIGATTMRPKSSNITHLTLLEQVFGQETQRARTWMSVMLPSYGTAVVSLREQQEDGAFQLEDSTNLISPWSSPESLVSLTTGFPDNSGYRIESKNPSAIRVPTRATVKSFVADWEGMSEWRMPYPVGTPGDLNDPELILDDLVVRGEIVHDLPAAMTDVRVFVIAREFPILSSGQKLGRRSIAYTSVFSPDFGPQGWIPGQALDLALVTEVKPGSQSANRNNYFSAAFRYGVDPSGLNSNNGQLVDRLIASRFISQLEPPRFNAASSDVVGNRLAQRRAVHGWDLGRWFTEPTLIVIGMVEIDSDNASINAIPEPVWINGQQVPASGKTLVTWIYPFESKPPVFVSSSREDETTNDTLQDDDTELIDDEG
ncbi:MAG: DUF4350 domain-containing protein [Phycisphaerales bacterium]|nr:DUF4350 domain-containing protein [Phycisphaerales bacterium]